jgi:hypothetical protein
VHSPSLAFDWLLTGEKSEKEKRRNTSKSLVQPHGYFYVFSAPGLPGWDCRAAPRAANQRATNTDELRLEQRKREKQLKQIKDDHRRPRGLAGLSFSFSAYSSHIAT